MTATKREPRRETSPPPWEWGGEHHSVERDGLLVLWSVVRTPKAELAVHRASLRGAHRKAPQISFDSITLKPSKRRWQSLTHEMLLALPANHRNAVVHWHKGEPK